MKIRNALGEARQLFHDAAAVFSLYPVIVLVYREVLSTPEVATILAFTSDLMKAVGTG